jgi:rSAM/selenodomain-associated transferase 1
MQTTPTVCCVVLVFLKFPRPGQVKTRLAKDIGDELAAKLYRSWIGMVLREMQPLRPGTRLVGYFDGASVEAFSEWTMLADEWWQQPVGDLSARLDHGFSRAFATGASASLAVGTDCLDLKTSHIESAFAILKGTDAVFGPATDGGYYLVGTSRHLPQLFENVRLSTSDALCDQLRQCDNNGWSSNLLPTLRDIDTLVDWKAHLQSQEVCR